MSNFNPPLIVNQYNANSKTGECWTNEMVHNLINRAWVHDNLKILFIALNQVLKQRYVVVYLWLWMCSAFSW